MKDMFVCFHNPAEENGWLSNWFLSDFEVDGVKYTSMEQYMIHCKAMLFSDEETAAEIMRTNDVSKIKKLGRRVYPFNEVIWSTYGLLFVTKGLLAKYRQNPGLKKQLLDTGDKLLVECAVRDKIWANGCSLEDDTRFDMNAWSGKNQLGFATMFVREELRRDENNSDDGEQQPPW